VAVAIEEQVLKDLLVQLAETLLSLELHLTAAAVELMTKDLTVLLVVLVEPGLPLELEEVAATELPAQLDKEIAEEMETTPEPVVVEALVPQDQAAMAVVMVVRVLTGILLEHFMLVAVEVDQKVRVQATVVTVAVPLEVTLELQQMP